MKKSTFVIKFLCIGIVLNAYSQNEPRIINPEDENTFFFNDFDRNRINIVNTRQVNFRLNNLEFDISNKKDDLADYEINQTSFQNYFILGLANLATHYIPNNIYYTEFERDFISPGFEILLGYCLGNRIIISTGLNYQFLYFNTKLKKLETNRPENIRSALMRNLNVPVLVRFKLMMLNNDANFYGTTGFYYSIPLFAQYTENRKISGGGGYSAGSITYTLSDNFYYTYLSLGFSKEIHNQHGLYVESFFCNQLFENFSNETRNPYWIGIKTGINFSLKKETNEK